MVQKLDYNKQQIYEIIYFIKYHSRSFFKFYISNLIYYIENSQMDEDYQMYKIVIIGDSGTGKTNISVRFVRQQFSQTFKPTVGVQFLTKIVTVKNTQIKATFWDTAGQQRYKSLSKVYYKGAAGIIIVYDITQPQTYVNVENWLRLANENLNINEVKMILVGNKADLQQQRKITYQRAKQEYKDKFDIDCFETSAKSGKGVDECVMFLIEKIYQMNNPKKVDDILPYQQDQNQEYQEDNIIDSVIQKSKISNQTSEKKTVDIQKNVFKQSFNKKQQVKPQRREKQLVDSKKGAKLDNNQKKKEGKKGGCC